MDNQQQEKKVQIKISDEVTKGFYANNMLVFHTPEEFVMDFVSVLGTNQGIVGAKIITSPGHAKRILSALKDNIEKYESRFGEIKIASAPSSPGEIGFEDRQTGKSL